MSRYEIKPESAKSIADEILRACDGQNVLITFWVAVPPKTEPRQFFDFLQQQGYLRVWIGRKVVRVDSDVKIKRLGARVQVIQDRIVISQGNRTRLTEALEIALRFGKDRINIVQSRKTKTPIPKNSGQAAQLKRSSLLHWLALCAL